MERNFQVVDLIDNINGRFVGQALFCAERKECPFYTVNSSRMNTGEILEAFMTGAKEVGGNINLTHINMPLEMNINMPYNEIRNTIVKEMQVRTVKSERGDSFEQTEILERNRDN